MSVLNTMLKDLEKRHGQTPQSSSLPAGVQVVASSSSKARPVSLILTLTLLILLLLLGAYLFLHKSNSSEPIVTAVTPPLPPAVAPVLANEHPIASAPVTPVKIKAIKAKVPPDVKKPIVEAKTLKTEKSSAKVEAAHKKAQVPVDTVAVQKNVSPSQTAEYQYQQALESIQQDQLNDATNQLKTALQLNPRHEAARKTLASVLLHEKKIAEAEQVLAEGQNLSPDNLDLAITLARLQVEGGELTVALNTLQRSSSYAGQSGEFLAFQASLNQKKGEHIAASNLLIRALQLNPGNSKWRLALATSQHALGQEQFAQKNAKMALNNGGLSRELQALAQQIISTANIPSEY